MALLSIAYYNQIIDILEAAPELKGTCQGIAWQVGCGAVGTVLGGVVAGPPGAFVVGTAGAFMGYKTTTDYQSLLAILRDLNDREKLDLQTKVQDLVGSLAIEDLVAYVQREVGRHILLDVVKQAATTYRQHRAMGQ